MPFNEDTKFACDLRKNNYSHQSLSFLCSDRGRAIWCAEPVCVSISNGEISLSSDMGEIVLKEDAGRMPTKRSTSTEPTNSSIKGKGHS